MKILPPPVVKGTATSIFAPSAYCFRLSKLRPFDERFRVVTISSTISICSTSRYRTHAITFRLVRGAERFSLSSSRTGGGGEPSGASSWANGFFHIEVSLQRLQRRERLCRAWSTSNSYPS